MLKDLKDIRLTEIPLDSLKSDQYAPLINNYISRVGDNHELSAGAKQAYQAHMGFYNSNLRKLNINKAELVQMSNQFAVTIGCREQPKLLAKTVGKMGLKGTPGLLIDRETHEHGSGRSGGKKG
jgi:ATP-dependent RNA helicase MSS116